MSDEREVTELEQAEAELEELQAELDDAVKQRDAALAEVTQYIGWKLSAQLEAKRADEAVAALAHCQHDRDALANKVEQADAKLAAVLADCQTETDDLLADCVGELEQVKAAPAAMTEQKEYFRQCWEVAEEALAKRDEPCVWVHETSSWWKVGCGIRRFDDVSKFCPNCGHPVVVQP